MSVDEWRPDVLEGYEQASLGAPMSAPVGHGDGSLERTLIRRIGPSDHPTSVALIVHGYNDYFFATHLADTLADHGAAVYAVDMRRAGRSLRPGNQAHHLAHISELVEDIADAARAANADAHARYGAADLPLIVHAHSTGALAATIWANDQPADALAGLILNGPLFGLPLRAWEQAAMRTVPALAKIRPRAVVVPAPSPYTTGLVNRGWEFNTAWKSPQGVGATAGWLAGTAAARRRVRGGLDIKVPVLVAHADSTGPDRLDNPRHGSQDTVVDVAAIRRYAPGIGPYVAVVEIPGAIHDVSLSASAPRSIYLDAVGHFVDRVVE
ncbi:alpha/beta hydrolase [Demequina sp. B12]|uniref:alpha/beta hydrolase n=1 Tax=Demequina sp. B12 TaxID=2992757 RepID=UPI00237C3449|nr:alpha/beta hydrolase [Demequina sp. B12]MDE0572116.1 alpha/beta hydrolase [Demequina sp. B12]